MQDNTNRIERPIIDSGTDSAPIIQNPNNNNQPQNPNMNNIQPQYQIPNNQPQYYNPPPQGNYPQVNPLYPGQVPYYTPPVNYNSNYKKDINYNIGIEENNKMKVASKRDRRCTNPKLLLAVSIILILVCIVDIIFQIGINYYSPLFITDSVFIAILGVIFIWLTLKGKSPNNYCLSVLTILGWVIGIGIRYYGIHLLGEESEYTTLRVVEGVIIFVRTVALFICGAYTV